jgi:hypothetical protein
LAQQSVFEIHPENVMAMFDLLDHGREFAAEFLGQPYAEDLADAVGGQTPPADFATPLEDFYGWGVALKDEIAAVFDRGDSVDSRPVDLLSFFFGELGS